MIDCVARWLIALIFSLVGGHFVVRFFVDALREKLEIPKMMQPWTARATGFLERFFFTILVGVNAAGYPAAMVTWLLVKMSTYWNFAGTSVDQPDIPRREHAFAALLGGLASMLFALLGGLFITHGPRLF